MLLNPIPVAYIDHRKYSNIIWNSKLYLSFSNIVITFFGTALFIFFIGYLSSRKFDFKERIITATYIFLITFAFQLVDFPKIKQVLGIGLDEPRLMIAKVQGQIAGDNEAFEGAAWAGPVTHPGIFVRTTSGTSCMGAFRYSSRAGGDGHFQCDDGRTGLFEFEAFDDLSGRGNGTLDGQGVSFEYKPAGNVQTSMLP